MRGLEKLNALSITEARSELLRCCGSSRWAQAMAAARPYANAASLHQTAEREWAGLARADFLEAFGHHPKIGAKGLRDKWASGEQKGVAGASEETLHELETGNQEYERRFGYIFLVCATGKSADEMLALLRKRMNNDPENELRVAAGEQAKITRIRLDKLLSTLAEAK